MKKKNQYHNIDEKDLTTISGLKNSLKKFIKSPSKNLIENEIIKKIVKFNLKNAKIDTELTSLNDIVEICMLLNVATKSNEHPYKNAMQDIGEVLQIYQKKITEILEKDLTVVEGTIEKLELFFNAFSTDLTINQIRQIESKSINLFSNPAKESIKAIDKKHEIFKKIKSQIDTKQKQIAYWKLYEDFLEGKKANILPISSQHIFHEGQRSMLPDTEFDVPSAEPEHPDRIGINNTMSFNPNTEQLSVLDSFKTNTLKKEFLHAFPWSVSFDSLNDLNYRIFDNKINLLNENPVFPMELQIEVMKYLLLSLDFLGKVTGSNGELAIRNFSVIKDITDKLHAVAQIISIPHLATQKEFKMKLKKMAHLLEVQNRQWENPEIASNITMNAFCHLNEQLIHKLVKKEFIESVLTPKTLPSLYSDRINNALNAIIISDYTPQKREDVFRSR